MTTRALARAVASAAGRCSCVRATLRERPRVLALGSTVLADVRGVCAAKIGDPVRFPGLVIVGVRLLPPRMVMIELVPHITYLDGTTVFVVVGVELAAIAVKPSDHGNGIQATRGSCDPID